MKSPLKIAGRRDPPPKDEASTLNPNSQVVKILLQKMNLAEGSSDLIEDMVEAVDELNEGILEKKKSVKVAEKRIWEMRKGGATGELELEISKNQLEKEILSMEIKLQR